MVYRRIALIAIVIAVASTWLSVSTMMRSNAIAVYSSKTDSLAKSRDARKQIEFASHLFPANADTWFTRARFLGADACEVSLALCDIRIQSLHKAAANRPFWSFIWVSLAWDLEQTGRVREAIQALIRGIEFGPHEIWVRRAVSEIGLRQWSQLAEVEQAKVKQVLLQMFRSDRSLLVRSGVMTGQLELLMEMFPDPGFVARLQKEQIRQNAR